MQIKSSVYPILKKQKQEFDIENIKLSVISNCNKFDPSHLKMQGEQLPWETTHKIYPLKVSKNKNYLNFVESKTAPLLLTRSIVNFSTV